MVVTSPVSPKVFRPLLACLLLSMIALVGCGEKKRARTTVPPPPSLPAPDSSAKTTPPATGEPTYDRDAKVLWTQEGLASWYGPPYHNRRGANGEIYDQNRMTAAHKTLPLNSIVRVTNLKTEHSAIVRITDRGPFIGDRIIDLSLAAAKAVDVWRPGVAKVKLEVLETPASIEKGGRWCVQVGAFTKEKEALQLRDHLQRRYHTAKVLEFPGPTGFWVRVRVLDDEKARAQEVAKNLEVKEGGVFMVRLD